jgi:hypothetical protein
MSSSSPTDPRSPFRNSKQPVLLFKTQVIISYYAQPAQQPAHTSYVESAQLQASVATALPYPIDHAIPIQLPTVASFIPNLPFGFPFRISIHSWEKPLPSRSMAALMQMHHNREIVMFEARAFIDGHCVAYDPRAHQP